jgi:hypothetical protein
MIAGCGFLTRLAIQRLLPGARPGALAAADLWIGLGALLAYLQLWSLGLRIGWAAWIAPLAAGSTGLVLGARRLGRGRLPPSLLPLGLAALGVLWLANRALAPAQDYDLGLYHLNAVGYALHFPAIPGLANLHERLGASNAHLVLVAFLHHGPWGGAAPHLASGLLVSMLFVDVASRFVARRPAGAPTFTDRLALLLVPAAVVAAGHIPTYRLSSPNLDLAAFVLVAAGLLYAAESVERGFRPEAALAAGGALAAAAATRPLYWLTTLLACGAVLLARRRPPLRTGAAVLALPGVLLAGWLARQAVLSGYPFFPATVAGLPVDWRVPASVVHDQNRWNDSWARWPGRSPDEVLGSWHWLSVWLRARAKDLDVIAPLAILAVVVPVLAAGRAGPRRPTGPMLAVVVPSLAALVGWFVVAPDPRFALAPIWLVPLALAAWALPPAAGRRPWALLLVATAVAAGLAAIGVRHPAWFLLAAFDLWALAALAAHLLRRTGMRRWLGEAALVSVALASVAIVADGGAFRPVRADGDGPLGTPPQPVASLAPFRTASGLEVWRPAGDADQCWGATLCAPQPSALLRLRGAGLREGFARR